MNYINNKIKTICLIIILIIYIVLSVFLLFFKRTTYIYSEKREVSSIPKFTIENFLYNDYTHKFNDYFVDSAPYKDKLVDIALIIKGYKGLKYDNYIKIIDTTNKTNMNEDIGKNIVTQNNVNDDEFDNANNNDILKDNEDEYKIIDLNKNKIFVIGDKYDIRGLTMFNGDTISVKHYANILNTIKQILKNVNIYSMIVPEAVSFYLPNELNEYNFDQTKIIDDINKELIDIIPVNIYDNLYRHKEEDIYLRTDTHWSQLGAFYAAEEFAKTANTSFKSLDNYYKNSIDNFTGSYYRYTEDYRFNVYNETFNYYKPKLFYDVIRQDYVFDNDTLEFVSSKIPYDSKYFYDILDKHSWAYGTFMNGDRNTTIIRVNNNTNRKLAIIKDSFGNALIPNLFYSFDEIHVIDYRWFPYNLIEYLDKNNITDVLFETNIALINLTSEKYLNLIYQNNKLDNIIIYDGDNEKYFNRIESKEDKDKITLNIYNK